MKIIAHRGGIQARMQNSPAGVRLAAKFAVDFVELDVVNGSGGGTFYCVP